MKTLVMKTNHPVDTEVCKKCGGFCCKYSLRVVSLLEELRQKDLDFLEVKSIDKKIIGNSIYFVLNQMCPHLTEEGCDLGEDRPDICKEFPPKKDDDWYHFCDLSQKLYSV